MEGPNNTLLDLATRGAAISPYQAMTSAVSSLVTSNPQDSRTRPINGWNYPNGDANVVSHSTCNFPPYASSLGPGTGPMGPPHKPGYSTFSPGTDFIPNCQQMQLSPLNSLPPRSGFPFYGDMYQPNPTSVSGSSIFSDLTSIPSIPRFDTDGTTYMTDPGTQNPGKAPISHR